MIEKRFVCLNMGKPNREQILKHWLNDKPLISDECAFLRHLWRKYKNDYNKF